MPPAGSRSVRRSLRRRQAAGIVRVSFVTVSIDSFSLLMILYQGGKDKARAGGDGMDKNMEMARRVAAMVKEAGGRTFYVGGFVRDGIRHCENKDIDIEVHGVTPETLAAILDSVGQRTVMGASFGIFGLRHYELDIAMPRSETATGRGHKDFEVFVDPFLGTEKAAMRRDFTMNALMQDVLTGEVVDHFGGVEDIRRGVIRHVNPATFAEDPLRVLRAAQFAARFRYTIAEETRALSRSMDLSTLARERVAGELEKALLKAETPSVFFEEMKAMNQLSGWFPELEALIGTEQDPRWHPEGNAWRHTMLVLDAAAALRDQAEYPLGLMYAALCHDLGKAVTTREENGRIRSVGHETAGVELAGTFMGRVTNETKLLQYVQNMVRLHMRPNFLAVQKSGTNAAMRLFDQSVCPEDLVLLARCDRTGQQRGDDRSGEERYLRENLAVYRERMARPCVMGADLVALGYKPCRAFKDALAYAHKLRLAGVSRELALPQTAAVLEKLLRESTDHRDAADRSEAKPSASAAREEKRSTGPSAGSAEDMSCEDS